MYLGDFKENAAFSFFWDTNDRSGASITRATKGTLKIYCGWGAPTATDGITDTEDVVTGVHWCQIDILAAIMCAPGHDYAVVLEGAVIDGQTVNAVLANFSVENRPVSDLQLAKAAKVIVNKAVQNKETGVIEHYDDDGETVILTQTPSESDTEVTRTPS